jgi:hypothetical protein
MGIVSLSLGSMSICRWGASMGSVGPYLYICGGSDDSSRLDTVERYDPYNDVWVHSEPMSSSRNGVGVCGGDGRIYAIGTLGFIQNSPKKIIDHQPYTVLIKFPTLHISGGFDGSMPLNTAEYYDTRGRYAEWIKISPMNQSRFGVGCCFMDGNVYAVGGSDGTNLRTVEKYDPDSNTWKLLAPMATARYMFNWLLYCFCTLFFFSVLAFSCIFLKFFFFPVHFFLSSFVLSSFISFFMH